MHEVVQDVVVMYTLVTIFLFKFFSNFLTFFTFIRFMRVLRVYVGYLLVRVYVWYLLVFTFEGVCRVFTGKLQFPGVKSLPPAFRPKISVFLRNWGCWFRIWFWFAHKRFSFGEIAIYSNKSDIHFAISSNKINIYFQLNDFCCTTIRRNNKICHSYLNKMQISPKLKLFRANQNQIRNQRPRVYL